VLFRSWWIYTFYATIAWAALWYVLYPAWPSLTSHTEGVAGYSQRADVKAALDAAARQRAPMVERIRAASLDQIRQTPDLLNFSIAGGKAMFADNCAPCHGAGGAGSKGFPNLADDDWIWGGNTAAIHDSIAYGVRNTNEKSRQSQMPRFGTDGLLTPAQISDLTELVLALAARPHDAGAAGRARTTYAEQCASCHGAGGEGNAEFGAPRLTDGIWLYGGYRTEILRSIQTGRGGAMPAWSERLDAATIKMLTIYVHALGGGK
jgi:cytochrome c oxidase cbb3-type subunit 3